MACKEPNMRENRKGASGEACYEPTNRDKYRENKVKISQSLAHSNVLAC